MAGDYDERLLTLYDGDNPDGADHAFYRALADRLDAHRIVDLGCGTGMLAVTMTAPGRSVRGIDPSANMLAIARARLGADAVDWLLGDATAIAPGSADLVIMTGNVAQHIAGGAWPAALRAIGVGLVEGGRLAFESRNPDDRAWESWAAEPPATRDTAFGPLTEWLEFGPMSVDGAIEMRAHNVFERKGEHLVETQTLVFRSEAELRADLEAAGLSIVSIDGGWDGEPVTAASRVLVVEARR